MMTPYDNEIYVTGATLYFLAGKCSYEEYRTNNYSSTISEAALKKKYYIGRHLEWFRKRHQRFVIKNNYKLPNFHSSSYLRSCDSTYKVVKAHRPATQVSSSDDGPKPADGEVSDAAQSTSKVKKTKENDLQESKVKKTKENDLPAELLTCGQCNMSISSISHLMRHLDKCRGATKRRNSETENQPPSSNVVELQIQTKDGLGEVIVGWTEQNSVVPSGPNCPRCSYSVPTIFDLPLHQRYHIYKDFISCPLCSFSTKYNRCYLDHIVHHTIPDAK